jgi:hypothetical protein
MSHYSDGMPPQQLAPPRPKLSLPYTPAKPNKNKKRTPGAGAGAGELDEAAGAKGNPGGSPADSGKEQTFS